MQHLKSLILWMAWAALLLLLARIPSSQAAAATAVWAAVLGFPLWRVWRVIAMLRSDSEQLRRFDLGLCPQCGYDLRGSAEKCPECGRPFTATEKLRIGKSQD